MKRRQDNNLQEGGPSSLRVVTYNILADQNASRDVEKQDASDRMYSHCKNEHIVKWRRHPLIVHELLEYSADIICLQEVDTDVFYNLLQPALKAKGYQGYYSQKGVGATSSVQEGCAILWSLNTFESVRIPDMRSEYLALSGQYFSLIGRCTNDVHSLFVCFSQLTLFVICLYNSRATSVCTRVNGRACGTCQTFLIDTII